jgi:hypothetical protein
MASGIACLTRRGKESGSQRGLNGDNRQDADIAEYRLVDLQNSTYFDEIRRNAITVSIS